MQIPEPLPTLKHKTLIATCDQEHIIVYTAFDREVKEVERIHLDTQHIDERMPRQVHGGGSGMVSGGPDMKDPHDAHFLKIFFNTLNDALLKHAMGVDFIHIFVPKNLTHQVENHLAGPLKLKVKNVIGAEVVKEHLTKTLERIWGGK